MKEKKRGKQDERGKVSDQNADLTKASPTQGGIWEQRLSEDTPRRK